LTYANIVQRGPDVPANPIPFPGFGPTAGASNGGNVGSVNEGDGDNADGGDVVPSSGGDNEDGDDTVPSSGGDTVSSSPSAFETMA